MGKFTRFCFSSGGKKFIGIIKYVTFGLIVKKNFDCLLKTSLKLAINYLLGNFYFTLCVVAAMTI